MSEKKGAACLMAFEYGTFAIAIALGVKLLQGLSSNSWGFRFLGVTLVVIGVTLLVSFYMGCVTVDPEPGAALAKSICCSVPLLFALAALGIFALAVSSKGGGHSLPERSYKEYRVGSYSKWMRNKVNDTSNWDKHYKKAIIKHHVCKKFGEDYQLDTLDEFHKRSLEPFESGCCKPPDDCNFNFSSPTNWGKTNSSDFSNNDCNRWDNDPNILCFNCQSCKAGFLQDLKSHWFLTGLVLVLLAGKQFLLGTCLLCLLCRDGD